MYLAHITPNHPSTAAITIYRTMGRKFPKSGPSFREWVGVSPLNPPPPLQVPCGGGGWPSRLITKSRCFQLSNQTIPVHLLRTHTHRPADSLRRNILHPLSGQFTRPLCLSALDTPAHQRHLLPEFPSVSVTNG